MSAEFIPFRKFTASNKIAQEELELLLTENEIPFEVTENVYSFDSKFVNDPLDKDFFIKLKQEDFERANELLMQMTQADIQQLPADYYLLSFTENELREVVTKQDEWNEFDIKIALQLLESIGISYSGKMMDTAKQQRYEALSKQETLRRKTFLWAYFSMLAGCLLWKYLGGFSFFIGPAIGLMGFALLMSKRVLPDGKRINTYSDATRKQGIILIIIGTLVYPVLWFFAISLSMDNY